jgi:hypothetical protein
MKRSLYCAFALLMTCGAWAQWDSVAYAVRDTTRILYDGGFDFREGIYFGFEDFRANRPSVALKDLLNDQGKPAGDLRQSNGKLFYLDSAGTKQRIDLDRAWGFCNRDVVYVRIGDGFSRIGLMGSVAHVVFDNTYRNWGYYGSAYGMGPSSTTVQEQRLLDMSTGNFQQVTGGGIYLSILHDEELVAEFQALPKRERNRDETIFRFMRRYNDRHPLTFPK